MIDFKKEENEAGYDIRLSGSTSKCTLYQNVHQNDHNHLIERIGTRPIDPAPRPGPQG